MPTSIDATYTVVTPLFCAGADPSRPELRLPSFKGVLRYWWRALAWSRCGRDLVAIQKQEDALFGSADGGQSRLNMSLAPASEPPAVPIGTVLTVSPTDSRPVGEGARYLGYGVMEAFARRPKDGRPRTEAGQLTRGCLRPPFDFTVQLRERDLDDEELASVKDALIAAGTLGGMGAKSRKGYGSLVIRSLVVNGAEHWSAPRVMDDMAQTIGALKRDDGAVDLPKLTALSKATRHVLLESSKKEPLELLDLVGREMMRFRSWGHNGKVLGEDSEKNFKDDHDLMKERQRKSHPRRIAFGLPHNYGKPKDMQVGPHDEYLDRRASPLFIHIHRCDVAPVAILSFVPARFLPDGRSDISVGGNKVSQTPENELYRPIHDFLDRLLDPSNRREPFSAAIEVKA
ncbi:MAG: type III-B CRISPR module RAMP protein Cmr1 [Armatimonadetes bacterium]|nr:type III-B CRISPR module RAMP protein Cmr1 [Armatimonadota bacterium]